MSITGTTPIVTAKPQYSRLPSFDELLESIQQPSEHSLMPHKPIPFNQPRKSPSYASHALKTSSPTAETFRPPSTPPSHHPRIPRGRGRASSAPSSLDAHYSYGSHTDSHRRGTVNPRAVVLGRDEPYVRYGHALGSTRRPSHERYGDRIQEIKDGDGEWVLNDIVSPDFLPPRARPHFHGRHYSTTSLPPISRALVTPSPTFTPITTSSTIRAPDQNKSLYEEWNDHINHHHTHFFGSQSPLSTCNPLTPRSISGSFKEQIKAQALCSARPSGGWWSLDGPEAGGDQTEEVDRENDPKKVMIPALPRMS